MKFTYTVFSLIAGASLVSAHGFVAQVTIDGKTYKGDKPGGASDPSVIRQISDPSPIKGATNPAVNCGKDAKPASLVADANAGSTISFSWKGADLSNWPHNTGPMLTYMASCGSTTCDKFDSTQAKWFKIDEVGKEGNDWAQQKLMDGQDASVTIPSALASGNYLIRHEIIALHLAEQKGGAEFYEGCVQLKVTGSGTGEPSSDELVSLPGAYSDDDPGIFDKNVYSEQSYQFPGPNVAKFGASDSKGNMSGVSASSSPSTSAPAASGSAGNSYSNEQAGGDGASVNNHSSNASSSADAPSSTKSASSHSSSKKGKHDYQPRTYSRIMRNLKFAHFSSH